MIAGEWIRESMPTHWGVARVKDHARVVNGYSFDSKMFSTGAGYPLVRIRDISSSETVVRYDGEWVPEAAITTGDVLVGMDGDFNVARWNGGDALLNQRVCCIRTAESMHSGYLYYALPTPLQLINEFTYSTTVKHLSSFDVLDIRVPFPPIDQQKLIANYLDRETARIDGLIAEKERMLALLEEKRAALISRVVTRGLDPNAPLKPSGQEWLGEIPAHWDEVRLGFLVSLQGGATPTTTKDEFWNGDIPWASPKDIKQPILFDTIDHVSELALSESSISLISPPALLLVVRGMILAKAIPTALIAVPMTINQDMKALQPKLSCLDPEYLKLVFDGLQEPLFTLIEESAHGTRCLRTDMLTSFKIPVPPLNEQRKIVCAIESERHTANALRESLQLSITLAKERRAALITAAVTGQIPPEEMAG